MRSLFRLLMSLIVSVGLLMALAAAGVVRFNPDAPLEPAAMGAKVQSGLTAALEKVQGAEYLAEINKEQVSAPSEQTGRLGRQTPDLSTKPEPQTPGAASSLPRKEEHDLAIDAALAVLTAWDDQPVGANPEAVLRSRLQSLGITPEQVDRIIRMCFWKGFVTLQHGPEDKSTAGDEALQHAFEQEVALKQAGFAALGLRFGEEFVAQARRLQLMQPASAEGGERR